MSSGVLNIFLFLLVWLQIVQSCKVEKVSHRISPGSTKISDIVRRFRPHFTYGDGCMSYPAVNKAGKMSEGLEITGSPGESCRDSRYQQTYARTTLFRQTRGSDRANTALMYANFFPKDQRTSFGGGHRYDWEEVIVFIDSNNRPIKAACSFHGKYFISRPGSREWDGDRVRVRYGRRACNNAFRFHTRNGDDPPIKAWTAMTSNERRAITNGCFESATPKIKDAKFMESIRKAWNEEKPPLHKILTC